MPKARFTTYDKLDKMVIRPLSKDLHDNYTDDVVKRC